MTSLVENCFLVQMPTQWPEQSTDSIEQFNRPTQPTDSNSDHLSVGFKISK